MNKFIVEQKPAPLSTHDVANALREEGPALRITKINLNQLGQINWTFKDKEGNTVTATVDTVQYPEITPKDVETK